MIYRKSSKVATVRHLTQLLLLLKLLFRQSQPIYLPGIVTPDGPLIFSNKLNNVKILCKDIS